VNDISDLERAARAVAYLASHEDEQPKGLKKFFSKLIAYRETGENLEGAMNHAKDTLIELDKQMQSLFGSINTMTEVVAEELSKEQIKEFSEKTSLPKE
jgi:hypothetical protein